MVASSFPPVWVYPIASCERNPPPFKFSYLVMSKPPVMFITSSNPLTLIPVLPGKCSLPLDLLFNVSFVESLVFVCLFPLLFAGRYAFSFSWFLLPAYFIVPCFSSKVNTFACKILFLGFGVPNEVLSTSILSIDICLSHSRLLNHFPRIETYFGKPSLSFPYLLFLCQLFCALVSVPRILVHVLPLLACSTLCLHFGSSQHPMSLDDHCI